MNRRKAFNRVVTILGLALLLALVAKFTSDSDLPESETSWANGATSFVLIGAFVAFGGIAAIFSVGSAGTLAVAMGAVILSASILLVGGQAAIDAIRDSLSNDTEKQDDDDLLFEDEYVDVEASTDDLDADHESNDVVADGGPDADVDDDEGAEGAKPAE